MLVKGQGVMTTIAHTPVDVVRGFQGMRALVLGDLMLDTYVDGLATRICKEGPVPVVDRTAEQDAPGGAANVAANLRALGAEVILVGLLGRDPAAARMRETLAQHGIVDTWLIEDDQCATMRKTRLSAGGQYVVRLDEGETRTCSQAGQRRILETVEQQIERCDLVVLPDYGYGAVPDAVIAFLRDYRAGRHLVLAVDAKHVLRYADARATVLTPSFAEAWHAVEPNLPVPHPVTLAEADRVGRNLRQQVDADLLAITLSRDGALLLERTGEMTHLPAHEVTRAGDVGAGDSFTAAIALALASGATPEQATQIGIDAAGIAITQQRTAVVRHQDLLRRVSLDDLALTISVKTLAAILDAERFAGRRIVFTNGVFDILHAGHVDLLRRAKALGDLLVVGLNSDASTQRLKGPTRPINRESDRLALVAALDPVDYAVLFDEDTPEELIRAFRPHIHVKGGDYSPAELKEAEAVAEVGARIEILSLVAGRSTTNVINKIGALFANGLVEAQP